MNASKKSALRFSQVCLIVFVLLLVFLDVRAWRIVQWFLDVSHGHGGTRDFILFMTTIYSCSICAWIAVVALWRLLQLVSKGDAFSRDSVRYLRITSICCFAVALITLASALYYLPMILLALCAGFMGAIVRIVMNSFESALSMREELNLVV